MLEGGGGQVWGRDQVAPAMWVVDLRNVISVRELWVRV